MTTTITGLPATLWRGYRQREYAEAFVYAGQIRMSSLESFREIEDETRRDVSEGVARLRVPGDVPVITLDRESGEVRGEATRPGLFNFSAPILQAAYFLCLSTTRAGAAKFGDTIVEVVHTQRLIDAVEAAVRSQRPALEVAFVEGFPVRYDKDGMAPAPALPERMRLTYGQKPALFSDDAEYRIAVVLTGLAADAQRYLDLTLPGVAGVVRIVS